MKSICQSAWQLTVAFGNLIVIVIAEARFFTPAAELLFFASLLFTAAGLFLILAARYAKLYNSRDE